LPPEFKNYPLIGTPEEKQKGFCDPTVDIGDFVSD